MQVGWCCCYLAAVESRFVGHCHLRCMKERKKKSAGCWRRKARGCCHDLHPLIATRSHPHCRLPVVGISKRAWCECERVGLSRIMLHTLKRQTSSDIHTLVPGRDFGTEFAVVAAVLRIRSSPSRLLQHCRKDRHSLCCRCCCC